MFLAREGLNIELLKRLFYSRLSFIIVFFGFHNGSGWLMFGSRFKSL